MDLIEGWPEDGKMITDGLTEGGVMTGFVWESKWGAARLGVLPNEVGSIKMPGLGQPIAKFCIDIVYQYQYQHFSELV